MSREVPEGWSCGSLEVLFTTNTPGFWGQEPTGSGDVQVLRATNLTKDNRLDLSRPALRSFPEKKLQQKALQVGDIILERSGGSPTQPVGRVGFFASGPGYSASNFMQIMRVDRENASPKFCFYLMAWLYSIGATERLQKATTGIRNLDFSTYMQTEVWIPPLHEQRRIAEILSSVDEAIAATRAVIEQTRKVRSEILTVSFPKDLAAGRSTAGDTFKGWSIEPASSICESIIDCKNRTPPVTEDGYAVVRTPNVRNGRFRYDGLQFTDQESFQEWTAKGVPRAGDILFTREAPYGEVCMAPAMAFCLGQRMMFLRPDTSHVSSDFLLYALQSGPVKKEMFRRAGGSTVGHLRVGDVRELPLPVAPKEVQLRLTSTLSSLDEALDSNEEALSRLKDCKSALMSDLLTGRKRVTDALPMAAE